MKFFNSVSPFKWKAKHCALRRVHSYGESIFSEYERSDPNRGQGLVFLHSGHFYVLEGSPVDEENRIAARKVLCTRERRSDFVNSVVTNIRLSPRLSNIGWSSICYVLKARNSSRGSAWRTPTLEDLKVELERPIPFLSITRRKARFRNLKELNLRIKRAAASSDPVTAMQALDSWTRANIGRDGLVGELYCYFHVSSASSVDLWQALDHTFMNFSFNSFHDVVSNRVESLVKGLFVKYGVLLEECDHCGNMVTDYGPYRVPNTNYHTLTRRGHICSHCTRRNPEFEFREGFWWRQVPLAQRYQILNYTANVLRNLEEVMHPKEQRSLKTGVELEVEMGSSEGRHKLGALVADKFRDFAILKSDSSIAMDVGFEIVTVPASLSIHREKFRDFYTADLVTGEMPPQPSSAGVHIHLDKSHFTPLQAGKLFRMMHHPDHSSFLSYVAGRTIDEDSEYCSQYIPYSRDATTAARNPITSHRGAITSTGKGTFEVRIFKSTNNPLEFFSYVDFVHAMSWFTKDATMSSVNPTEFADWIDSQRKQFPFLAYRLSSWENSVGERLVKTRRYNSRKNKKINMSQVPYNPEVLAEAVKPLLAS